MPFKFRSRPPQRRAPRRCVFSPAQEERFASPGRIRL